jgi:seryl-tRNA synthetase
VNKQFALKMLDSIEGLQIENLALRVLLEEANARRNVGTEQTEKRLQRLSSDPQIRQKVRELLGPVRQRLHEDADLEEAMQQFVRIVPPPTGVN